MTSSSDREDQLLAGMLAYEMRGKSTTSFKTLAKDLEFMERTKSWRSSWKSLIEEKKFVETVEGSVYTGQCRMTSAGKDYAATPEYLEYQKELTFVPKDNTAHQTHLKKRLLNDYARIIFDALLKYGALSRQELATLARCNERSHKFSYGLKDLKEKGIVEVDSSSTKGGKKLRLSDKAFLEPSDRPKETSKVDPTLLENAKSEVSSRKRKKGCQSANEDLPPKEKKPKTLKGSDDHHGDGDDVDLKSSA